MNKPAFQMHRQTTKIRGNTPIQNRHFRHRLQLRQTLQTKLLGRGARVTDTEQRSVVNVYCALHICQFEQVVGRV